MSKTKRGDPWRFIMAHLNHKGDDCLIWPYARKTDGYGHIRDGDVITTAHLVMCRLVYGEKIDPRHEARHLCGKGSAGCVNPKHLAWGTPEQNHADRLTHGTSNRGTRNHKNILTHDQVMEIHARKGESPAALGREYGIVPSNIFAIWQGKSWGWLTGEGHTLPEPPVSANMPE